MPQIIYDDEAFFAEYAKLRRSREGLDGAPEWPALRAMLPELAGKRVLDLGCGNGWFCRYAREAGAAEVMGVDVSEKMLEKAREMTADAAIDYVRSDMEMFELPTASLDLVYSSLAFHYIEDFGGLAEAVHRWLAPGGSLVFSVEHPIMTASPETRWMADEAGGKAWPLRGYSEEGPRSTNWLAEGVIKQHRTLATTLNTLIGAGFALTHLEEWTPTAAKVAASPVLAEERERPAFLLVAAGR